MHGSLHTGGTESGFVDILHRTNGLQTSGLFKKVLHDAMLQPLVAPDAWRFLLPVMEGDNFAPPVPQPNRVCWSSSE